MLDKLISGAPGQISIGITPSTRAERALLVWIPADSYLCTFRTDRSVHFNSRQSECRWSCVYAPTGWSFSEVKGEFCWKLSQIPRNVLPTDVVFGTDDFNAQLGYLAEAERHIWGRFYFPSGRTYKWGCGRMRKVVAVFSSHNLYRLIKNTGPLKQILARWSRNMMTDWFILGSFS